MGVGLGPTGYGYGLQATGRGTGGRLRPPYGSPPATFDFVSHSRVRLLGSSEPITAARARAPRAQPETGARSPEPTRGLLVS